MLVPLFNLFTHRPDLVVDHVAAYVSLAQDEISSAKRQIIRRAIAGAVALVFAGAFLALSGVAIMLGAVLFAQPQAALTGQLVWTLVLVPGVALLGAIVAASVAMKSDSTATTVSLSEHFHRDIAAFRQAIATKEARA